MPINVEELILVARDMLTEEPESVEYSRDNLFSLIKPAIAIWQDQTNADMQRRQNFIVESDEIAIVNGVADLLDEIQNKGYRLEFIKDSDLDISINGVTDQTPNLQVKFVNSQDRLVLRGRQDKFYTLAYLSGSRITFRAGSSSAINTVNGTIILRAPVIPADLTTMNTPLMYEIATVVAQMAKQKYQRSQAPAPNADQ